MGLTLKEAETIVDASLAKAREMNLNPMCVAVVDAGGLPIQKNGELVGAVGATGAQAVDDETCCRAGLAAAGL
jgi:uncharacterized protein GlcG (DUF336 family)